MDSKEDMQKAADILSGILDQLRGLATKDKGLAGHILNAEQALRRAVGHIRTKAIAAKKAKAAKQEAGA